MSETAEIQKDVKKSNGGLNFLIDFMPLLVFFATYKYFSPASDSPSKIFSTIEAIIYGTGAFMVAIIISLIVSKWKLGKVSPMLWLSAILVLGFGALTIIFRNETFIQIKPTIIYLFFAAVLFGGLLRGRAMLKYLLQAAFEGLDEQGWLKLSRNWAWFFVFLAVANTVIWLAFSFDTWLTLKVWGFTSVSFIFTFAQIPMLLRHGLAVEEKKDAEVIP